VAIQVAFPLREEIRDDRMEVPREKSGSYVGVKPTAESSPQYKWGYSAAVRFAIGWKIFGVWRHVAAELRILRKHRLWKRQGLTLRQQRRRIQAAHKRIMSPNIKSIAWFASARRFLFLSQHE
jgi:hypothetical protein